MRFGHKNEDVFCFFFTRSFKVRNASLDIKIDTKICEESLEFLKFSFR